MKPRMIMLISAGATVAMTLGAASAAMASGTASPDGVGPVPYYRYSLVNKTTTYGYTNKAQLLASCTAYNAPMSCTIAQGKEANRTIGVDLGATYSQIASTLHITSSRTVTITVSCTAHLRTGQRWGAWPYGTHYHYKVKRSKYYNGSYLGSTVGRYYHNAFSPGASRISCGLF